MAQICRLELQTEIKSSPDRIFDIYKNKTSLMPKISPDKLKSIEVLEGDGKSVGSVRLWTYVMGKKCCHMHVYIPPASLPKESTTPSLYM